MYEGEESKSETNEVKVKDYIIFQKKKKKNTY